MLLRSPNVREVRRHKSGELFQLEVTTQGNDERMPARLGNPRRYSHDHETDDNPARNWMLRHLFGGRDIYQRPALDCITTGSRPNPTAR